MYFCIQDDATDTEEYLPRHLSPRTVSLATTNVVRNTVHQAVSHTNARDAHMADKTVVGIALLIAALQSAPPPPPPPKRKPNVQSTRTSVMHLLRGF